ncbi:MAG: VWA domain-containing protein [Pyrinomonadaceae bacterium]
MQVPSRRNSGGVFTVLLLCTLLSHTTSAQQKSPAPAGQSEEVVRTTTELVQTDLMVFDKEGKFYDGLKQEQLELRVDKKPRPILFFERITAGSANEEAQLAAARGGVSRLPASNAPAPVPLDRGRTVFFYVDDLHLSPGSMIQARTLLLRFIDREMGQNDEVAITSASGQIGFLQQLTDNKSVLRRAAERLKPRPYSVRDFDRPPMSEHEAMLIDNNDMDVLNFFVDQVVRNFPGTSRAVAESMVRGRAQQILAQAGGVTTNTLASLQRVVDSSAKISGRKLLFFISDGFFLDPRSDSYYRLQSVTSAAARAGVVIYSIDARGLIASLTDASSDVAFDPSGRLQRGSMGEISASQDGLNALARDTGGRALFNTNDLSSGVTRALKETSTYYLIAWRPENEEQRSAKASRIEVSVVGRPNLVVRLRRGVAEKSPTPATRQETKPVTSAEKQAAEELRDALKSIYPDLSLRTALSVEFLDMVTTGPTLAASFEIGVETLTFVMVDGRQTANVDIIGAVYDAGGEATASFQDRLTVKRADPGLNSSRPTNIGYNSQFKLKPGLYQVRVAVRDLNSGSTGGARRWIEIPDLASGGLMLSSLVLGEKAAGANEGLSPANSFGTANLNIDHRFARSSHLRFMAFVYNAARRANSSATTARDTNANLGSVPEGLPDVAIQVQVLRDDQPVITTTLRKVEINAKTDLARLPYAADVLLADLQPGRYLLLVTAIDRVAKSSATQQSDFVID